MTPPKLHTPTLDLVLGKHTHSIAAECLPTCPAHNPEAWKCGECMRQLPMMSETEDWPVPLCGECFEKWEDLST